ncbi:MAG: type II secretion system F family protein [Vagococcus sp.]|uniref:type II secretion system F family protein n=1 Tax=Vagococcus sp. TaxID=1933889 RepID=UPI002FCB74BB
MPLFHYESKDIHGNIRKGKMSASHADEVTAKLKAKKLRVLSVVEAPETLANKEIKILKEKIKPDALVKYLQQLSMLINSGIGLLEAHRMLLVGTTDKPLKKAMESIIEKLEEGQAFSLALESQDDLFPQLMVSLVKAAEMSGTLDVNLKKLAVYYEKRNKSRKKIISALIYPAILLILSVAVSIFLMVSIVPLFVELFDGFDTELPVITKITMAISDAITNKWWLITVIILAVVFLHKTAMKVPSLRLKQDEFNLKIPLFGPLIAIDSLSSIFSTMANLLSSSVKFSTTLDLATEIVSNNVMKGVLIDAKLSIEQGGALSDSFEASPYVPIHTSQMMKVGETTGNLDSMLEKLSEIYEEEVDMVAERLKTILEPMIIIIIAILIGFIVAAIMIPMFSMYDAIQG